MVFPTTSAWNILVLCYSSLLTWEKHGQFHALATVHLVHEFCMCYTRFYVIIHVTEKCDVYSSSSWHFYYVKFQHSSFYAHENLDLNWLRGGRRRVQSSSPSRVKNFLFSTSSRPALGPTQPPIQWILGALSPGIKRQGHDADHSPPTSAEVKKMWIYTSTPPYIFMA
jgi:hypothetical protein